MIVIILIILVIIVLALVIKKIVNKTNSSDEFYINGEPYKKSTYSEISDEKEFEESKQRVLHLMKEEIDNRNKHTVINLYEYKNPSDIWICSFCESENNTGSTVCSVCGNKR